MTTYWVPARYTSEAVPSRVMADMKLAKIESATGKALSWRPPIRNSSVDTFLEPKKAV